MGAKLRRFPEHRVTLAMFSGTVTDDESVELFKGIDERDRDFHVIVFFGEDADLCNTLSEAPHLKRVIAEMQAKLVGDRHAVVCLSPSAKEYLAFLMRYSATGSVHPTIRRVFPDLKEACDWLGLSDDACKALTEETSLQDRHRPAHAEPQLSGFDDQALR